MPSVALFNELGLTNDPLGQLTQSSSFVGRCLPSMVLWRGWGYEQQPFFVLTTLEALTQSSLVQTQEGSNRRGSMPVAGDSLARWRRGATTLSRT